MPAPGTLKPRARRTAAAARWAAVTVIMCASSPAGMAQAAFLTGVELLVDGGLMYD